LNGIAAILLAAGSGSRMGRTKQLLRIGGQSLVHRAATAGIDAGCKPVIIVTGSNAEAVAAEVADLPVQIALNPDWPAGMGTSIRRGLSAALATEPSISAVILMLCDQPHLDAKILRDLMAAAKPMAACEYSGTLGPPCWFGRSMFDSLSRLADAEGAKHLLLKDRSSVATIPWPPGAEDLDSPADWDRFCQNAAPPAKSRE
jgi:molybdenum cofactor cytidylyltransferase